MRRLKVSAKSAGKRADVVVAGSFPRFSRSALKALFKGGFVKIGQKLARPGHKLHAGETLVVNDSLLNSYPKSVKLPVIYQDDDVVVINKPAGVLTHSKGSLNQEATVASFLNSFLTDKKLTGNRAGIVHRLDRDTSGLIICARNSAALAWLQKQFSARKVKKVYQAIVEGVPKEHRAVIDAPIERNPKRPQSFRVGAGGKTAQTVYDMVKTIKKGAKSYSLLKIRPTTGRTHQIRVHMAYIGHPVVGDKVYGSGDGEMLLHASELELTLPSGQRKSFKTPLPERLSRYIQGDNDAR